MERIWICFHCLPVVRESINQISWINTPNEYASWIISTVKAAKKSLANRFSSGKTLAVCSKRKKVGRTQRGDEFHNPHFDKQKTTAYDLPYIVQMIILEVEKWSTYTLSHKRFQSCPSNPPLWQAWSLDIEATGETLWYTWSQGQGATQVEVWRQHARVGMLKRWNMR